AGSGKTRLTADLARLAERQGGRVLVARATLPERETYGVVLEAVRSAAAFLPEGMLDTLDEQRTPRNESERIAQFERFATALDRVSQSRPVLLVLEDLHCSSDRTVALFEHLVRRAADRSVLIVATIARDAIAPGALLRNVAELLVEQRFATGIFTEAVDPASSAWAMQHSTLIGREADMTQVEELLAPSSCTTIVGAPGVGKTRLALEVLNDRAGEYRDGAHFIDLSTFSDAARVLATVAAAVRASAAENEERLLDNVVRSLKERHVMLVLDNCEHVLAGVRPLVERLLERCANLTVLATSRAATGVANERVYRLPSLAFPETEDDLTPTEVSAYASVALLVERARRVVPGFTVTAANAQGLRQIARRLDGVPLAIELAAPRLAVLSAGELARRLDQRFALLEGNGAVSRQRTLAAAIAWSYDLLDDSERTLLRRLSILRGSWTASAAVAICADGESKETGVLATLARLVEKSLVTVHAGEEEPRFALLESIREFALERLKEAGEDAPIAARHCAYFAEHAAAAFERSHTSLQAWVDRARVDFGNYRAAIDWGLVRRNDLENGCIVLGSLISIWYEARIEGLELLETALSVAGEIGELARARVYLLASHLHDQSGAVANHASEALEIFERTNYACGAVSALGQLSSFEMLGGRLERALELTQRQFQLACDVGY
ncbi:MAG: AAA family ATPase, partial [Candidatus Eremiobacteraeota bacterium]|nr:AAA family ATPase [Candidatus Eremiobacteraeota bacterium]